MMETASPRGELSTARRDRDARFEREIALGRRVICADNFFLIAAWCPIGHPNDPGDHECESLEIVELVDRRGCDLAMTPTRRMEAEAALREQLREEGCPRERRAPGGAW